MSATPSPPRGSRPQPSRGLNPRFANTADIIANSSPLPDFKSATNMLRVKELRLGTEHKEASASALVASTAPRTSPSRRSTSSSSNGGGGGKSKNKGKGPHRVRSATVLRRGCSSSGRNQPG
ncbi:hypothetical protein U9M48_015612 [Paspalum notatum var. saurae]|uniref:Uncharacterized protein n=1 Tax=Paspalum notatum var. saurae TaxID=547442 RepID=A0AAQ3T3G4_PASNO